MDVVIYGDLRNHGVEVVRRGNLLFVRYEAGAHVVALREDDITAFEYKAIAAWGRRRTEGHVSSIASIGTVGSESICSELETVDGLAYRRDRPIVQGGKAEGAFRQMGRKSITYGE